MKTTARISTAEWEVMNLVWERAPLSAAAIVDEMVRRKDWASRTTRTLIDRLVRKKALTYDSGGPCYLYRPLVSIEECVRQESRSFLDRVFGGEPAAMLLHLVKEAKLSSDEIAELRRILKQKEK